MSTMAHKPSSVRPQQGVVLIVVLIMLVIIGLTSAAVMRNALTADLISANVRSEALATEAAQISLAFCEQQITLGDASSVPTRAIVVSGPHWASLANWSATAVPPPTTLTADQLRSAEASFRAIRMPQCMAENATLPNGVDTVTIVTARGFSPDYHEDPATGRVEAGSVVWLQSTLRLQ
jgi:type IV pilus assembly protein PilX